MGELRKLTPRIPKLPSKQNPYDPYVKFFRWATDRFAGRDGIVCFVSNNSFIDQQAFDGMQKHLLSDFTDLYHVDLHGNVRKNPKLSGTTHNVFGIQVGVGISIAVRHSGKKDHHLNYYRLPEQWRKEEKLGWLTSQERIGHVKWETQPPGEWLGTGKTDFEQFAPIATKEGRASDLDPSTIFKTYSLGKSPPIATRSSTTLTVLPLLDVCEAFANITMARSIAISEVATCQTAPPSTNSSIIPR